MPQAVTYVLAYLAGPTGAIAYAAQIAAASYIITAAAVPAIGSTHRRKAARRARAVL